MTTGRGEAPRTAAGPGRALVAVYAVFALAAGARACFQVATKLAQAPLAYTLSAVAALVYMLATVALARAGSRWRVVAWAAVGIELAGVLTVGVMSDRAPAAFPDATVWSGFGRGYGYVPLVLPLLGLAWLRHTRSAPHRPGQSVAPEGTH